MDDLEYIQKQIDENRMRSVMLRNKIREYAECNFGWNVLIEKYINYIKS
jgi:hypothetical protein